ncbi:Aromatic peroxygenase [Psilocybe cubensis]|uniref:Heme haloperoxidase family profile domain-containing protein n=2 Tax=Psilocybe cubensis TaxID=181762 RepID=A0A8H8CGI2_PSICU|nr:Aromatic peroxygenase [Psilocybe cubensis]KAH9474945.1 Aromatic peroxygenase [Psilocybe cubensis]
MSSLKYSPPGKPPGPLKDTSSKLVNDARHPWKPVRPSDQRGPCPGLNTLASHGWLPRNGIATPAQIITAVQEGYNMENDLARFVTYAAHLVDGNVVTDLLSIGGKSKLTGPAPPPPAIVGGLNTHAVFEGDASNTRSDAFLGNNHEFNETLFDQLVGYANKYGAGKYNVTVAGEFKWRRIQDSIATNPEFNLLSPRIFTVYAEAVFPINFFIDGRQTDRQLDLDDARSFLQNMRFPDDFHRRNGSIGADEMRDIAAIHPINPGRNVGKVNNYVEDPTSAGLADSCKLYSSFVTDIVQKLYPAPTGNLRKALKINLDYFYNSIPVTIPGCAQVFPYGS